MFNNKERFNNLRLVLEKDFIYTGDTLIEIRGYSIVILKVNTPQSTNNLVLENTALYKI